MPKEGRIISHLRLFIPKYRAEIPFKEVLEWAEKVYKKACAKSGKPIRLSDDEFWKDKADIARAFRQGLKRAYETVDGVPAKRILEKLPMKSAERAREMVFDQWSSVGPGAQAAILAGLWLSGLPGPYPQGLGEPVLITEKKRAGQLRKQLQNLLLHLGEIISDANFSDEEIKKANERIYQLVKEFVLDNLEVHIGLEVVPESVIPADSTEVLDIKYKIYEFFLGETIAKDLRARCIEKKYPYPLNPDEYIGNIDPAKAGAYFDMYLEICVKRQKTG